MFGESPSSLRAGRKVVSSYGDFHPGGISGKQRGGGGGGGGGKEVSGRGGQWKEKETN